MAESSSKLLTRLANRWQTKGSSEAKLNRSEAFRTKGPAETLPDGSVEVGWDHSRRLGRGGGSIWRGPRRRIVFGVGHCRSKHFVTCLTSGVASAAGSVVMGSSLISLSPFFVEFSGLSAIVNSFYRMAIGGLVFLLLSFLRKERFPRPAILGLCLLAASTIALDLVVWNQSVIYIGAGLSTVLANLEIVFLVLIGTLIYREELPPLFLSMCGVIALGVYLLIHPYLMTLNLNFTLGILFALGASFIYSLYLLLLKIISAKNDGSPVSTVSMLATIILMGATMLGIAIVFLPQESFSIPGWHGLSCVVANGLLSQVVGWLLITTGLKKVSLSLSGLLMLAQPAFSFILDCLFVGRNTEALQIVGVVLLLAAIYGASQSEKKRSEA